MAKKQFKAESKRLLDMMINSIYTHKDIFLRELISNGSDALDKLYYQSLESKETGIKRSDFAINIEADKEQRILKISDNGIGMTKEELEDNLGTIAKSGSLNFKNENEQKKDIDIIGQFGVGFYSAFMVADKVTVISKAFGADTAYKWESTGADGYTVQECEKDSHGTDIILSIKADAEEENYSTYLEEFKIRRLITTYSDYVRYPIQMMVARSRKKAEDSEEYESYMELETLNSMEPIWKRQKSKVKSEDYNNYYKEKFMDYQDPSKVIRTAVEGVSSYTALMFIPSHAPYDYYTKEYEKGLQLYSSGVMIMDKCSDLLPDYFNFVKGLVDSQDLSLNISRELLQHDRQLKNIAKNLEKKIKSELLDMQKNDRDAYEKFFENFGKQLKYGIYENYGIHKEVLEDLILFYSSVEKKQITLDEYVTKMSQDQKYIYYAAGETIKKIDMLPQTELIKDKGYEILYLTDEIDEFVLQVMREYKDKEFKSVSSEDMTNEESAEIKDEIKKKEEDNKDLLTLIKETLDGKVSEVKLSPRLKNSPVCLTAKGDLSLEMEKVLNSMPMDQGIKAEQVLEINPNHKVMDSLVSAFDGDKELVKTYANLLYNQALLIAGMPIEDPVAFGNDICKLMTK
ncbi:MAG TPA: molecular chaperone HtpG [Anaerovoracaceae bacterium]|nr:molecular chaperone HtpG [Anaerovoracaceae bacterium]